MVQESCVLKKIAAHLFCDYYCISPNKALHLRANQIQQPRTHVDVTTSIDTKRNNPHFAPSLPRCPVRPVTSGTKSEPAEIGASKGRW